MKKLIVIIFIHLGIVCSFAQLEYRLIPPIVDPEFNATKTLPQVFRPRFTPPADGFQKGPDVILTSSGIQIINIVDGGGGQSETYITIDPKNLNRIIASANDMRYNTTSARYRMAAYYSEDGGKTWKTTLTPPNQDVFISLPTTPGSGLTNVDPGLAFDAEGNVYYSYIVAQVGGTGNLMDGGVFINKSTDGGKTWSDPIPVVYTVGGGSNQDAHDKPFIACDANPNSQFKNRIYVTWFYISASKGPGIGFSFSTDGENFSPPTFVPGSINMGSVQSPMPIVDKDGTLYVIWESKDGQNTTVYLQKSTDGGVSWYWPSPRVVQIVRTIGEKVNLRQALPNKGNMRVSSHPYITLGKNPGELYVVQAGKDENNRYRIYFAKSTNGGESWINKIRVDDNPYSNDMFFPAIAFDPVSGILAVAYYSSANDPENKAVDLYVAVSFDGGNTWKNIRVTPQSWYLDHSNAVIDAGGASLGRYWGDYLSIAAYDGKIFPCFWMPNAPRGTFYSNNAYVAILTSAPMPVENLQYVNTYENPTSVTLTWTDPTTNLLGGNLGNFKIWIYRNNQKIAEVEKGVQTYTDNTLIDGETYTFSLKVVDQNNLESPFVSISFTAGGALKPMPPVILFARPHPDGILLTWENPSQHIDSTYFHDFDKIEVFHNNNLIHSIEKSSLKVGEIQTLVIPVETRKFYNISLRAIGKRGDKTTPSELSEQVLAYSGAPLESFSENFDNTENLTPYYTDGTTGKWGLTNKAALSLPNSLTDSPEGIYQPKSDNLVIFAPVVVTPPNTTLSFEHIAIIDSLGDVGVISISRDFGKTWQEIAWFDQRRSENFLDDVTKSSWKSEHISLASYSGDTILIRFSLVTNPLRNKDGWYIDNIRLDDDVNFVKEIIEGENNFAVEIFPNPASYFVSVNLSAKYLTDYIISVYNSLGQLIWESNSAQSIVGNHSVPLDISRFTSGTYSVICRFGHFVKQTHFTVIK